MDENTKAQRELLSAINDGVTEMIITGEKRPSIFASIRVGAAKRKLVRLSARSD